MPLQAMKAGVREVETRLFEQIQKLYGEDDIPWVVGYSGGKDSTATLQLVWRALAELPQDQRKKPVHVISTDTLVENPIVASWVARSLEVMQDAAQAQGLPVESHRLTPAIQDTFWVNLIGRGYPAPRHMFRWCTERLKISPSNTFIRNVVKESGEAILVLGTRKAESAARARTMERLEEKRMRDRLSPNTSLPNSLVYSPIEDWSNDDVWMYLNQVKNPWGFDNRDLLTMYQGASEDGECPLVVDTSTPSCGDSRFGCWVCTLVEEDKSMRAMIQNDEEKEWMQPLLDLRNRLDPDRDEEKKTRDFRRMSGLVQLYYQKKERNSEERELAVIRGPYTQDAREGWLRSVLEAQTWVRENGPDSVRELELISFDELEEIRRLWVVEKHEFEDSVPSIYHEATGERYPGPEFDDQRLFSAREVDVLRKVCGGDELRLGLLRELIDTEHRFRTMMSRRGLFDALESAIKKHFYENEQDATERAKQRHRKRSMVGDRAEQASLLNSAIAPGSGAADDL